MRGGMTPPVKEGEEVDVTIEAVGEKGDGVAKVQGFVLFVPNTQAGERKRVRVTRVLTKVGFAEVIGDAETEDDSPAVAEPEPEFEANEHLDSESFGDEEPGNEDSEDDFEDDSEEPEATEEELDDLDNAQDDEPEEEPSSDEHDVEPEAPSAETEEEIAEEESEEETTEEPAEEESEDDDSDDDDSEDDEKKE